MLTELCNILMNSLGLSKYDVTFECQINLLLNNQKLLAFSNYFMIFFFSEKLFLCRNNQVNDFSKLLTDLFKVMAKTDGSEL